MQLTISGENIESLLYRENKPILELKISYPQIMGPLSKQAEFHFNDYYRKQSRQINLYARTKLHRRASEECRSADEKEYDFTMHSHIRTFSVPRLDPRYTSIILDQYHYEGRLHGMTQRTGNTWDLSRGVVVPLSYFFRKNAAYRGRIMDYICNQIKQQKEGGEIPFFENPLRIAKTFFQEANYYLSNDGIILYYPLYTLAPYCAGILSYKIPFGTLDGCWASKRKPTEIPAYTGSFATERERLL